MLCVPHLERARTPCPPHAVEDHDAAGAVQRDEAREPVDELARIVERARMQEVVAVEEVQRRLSHRAVASPRRGAGQRRRSRSATRPSPGAESGRRRRRCGGRGAARPCPRRRARRRPRPEVGVPHRRLRLTCGRPDPEPRALDLAEVAREVLHHGNRQVLDSAGRGAARQPRSRAPSCGQAGRSRWHRLPRRSAQPRRGSAGRSRSQEPRAEAPARPRPRARRRSGRARRGRLRPGDRRCLRARSAPAPASRALAPSVSASQRSAFSARSVAKSSNTCRGPRTASARLGGRRRASVVTASARAGSRARRPRPALPSRRPRSPPRSRSPSSKSRRPRASARCRASSSSSPGADALSARDSSPNTSRPRRSTSWLRQPCRIASASGVLKSSSSAVAKASQSPPGSDGCRKTLRKLSAWAAAWRSTSSE